MTRCESEEKEELTKFMNKIILGVFGDFKNIIFGYFYRKFNFKFNKM